MSFKRRVLSALGKDVLLEICRGLELDVTTRMGVEELRDALAKSKRAKLDAIVQESLSRDTLKDICGAVGLDDTGKEKAALVERILAAGGDKAANSAGYRVDPAAVVPLERLQLFAFGDDYSFGVLQSSSHWEWTKAKGGRLKEDIVYATEVWRTHPWPQEPREEQVAVAARGLRRVRLDLMSEHGWSLRSLHQAAEVEGPHPLKDAQDAFDAAVADAYGMPPDQGPTEFLLELNQLVAEDEQKGRKVRGPGLPDHLDPNDPRWFSTDCIEPPSVGS
jgi:hypothetical protein